MNYNNVAFTLGQFPSQSLENTIYPLMAKENDLSEEDIPQENALLAKNWEGNKRGKSKFNNKEEKLITITT